MLKVQDLDPRAVQSPGSRARQGISVMRSAGGIVWPDSNGRACLGRVGSRSPTVVALSSLRPEYRVVCRSPYPQEELSEEAQDAVSSDSSKAEVEAQGTVA